MLPFLSALENWKKMRFFKVQSYTEYRKNESFAHRSAAMFNILDTGKYFYAQLANYSTKGMGFESPFALKVGTDVIVKLNNPPYRAASVSYPMVVVWCRGLDDNSAHKYRIGMKFY